MKTNKNSAVSIRTAAKKDLALVLPLKIALTDYHCRLDSRRRTGQEIAAGFKKFWREKIGTRKFKVFLAYVGDDLAGYFLTEIKKGTAFNYDFGYIADGYIKPEYRRRGLGRKLMRAAITWFKKQKISYVHLHVDCRNKIGYPSWKSLGFGEINCLMRKKI